MGYLIGLFSVSKVPLDNLGFLEIPKDFLEFLRVSFGFLSVPWNSLAYLDFDIKGQAQDNLCVLCSQSGAPCYMQTKKFKIYSLKTALY